MELLIREETTTNRRLCDLAGMRRRTYLEFSSRCLDSQAQLNKMCMLESMRIFWKGTHRATDHDVHILLLFVIRYIYIYIQLAKYIIYIIHRYNRRSCTNYLISALVHMEYTCKYIPSAVVLGGSVPLFQLTRPVSRVRGRVGTRASSALLPRVPRCSPPLPSPFNATSIHFLPLPRHLIKIAWQIINRSSIIDNGFNYFDESIIHRHKLDRQMRNDVCLTTSPIYLSTGRSID